MMGIALIVQSLALLVFKSSLPLFGKTMLYLGFRDSFVIIWRFVVLWTYPFVWHR